MALSSGGAEAGPSSAPAAQANMLSYRELHDILESSSSTTSTADISKQLHARLARLTACNKPPSGPTPASRSKVTSPAAFSTPDGSTIRLDALQQELCLNFSEAHHIDEVEAATVLRLFLDSQDTDLDALARHASDDAMAGLPKRPRRAKPSSRPHVDVMTAFMDALTAFYLEERLSVLRCVSALLRLADDSYSNLHDVANDVLSNFADEAFGLGCLARFQQLAAESLDDGIRENTSQSVLWATHNLREQVALLEVVTLLYYSRLDPSASFVSSLLAAIRQTDFGRKQAGAGFLDSEGAGIIDCVSGLLLLLTIESLDLERVMDGFDFFSPPPKGSLLDASHVFADAVDYIKSTTAADTVRAPLMLAWSFWLSRVDQAIAEWKAARPTEQVPRHLNAIESAALKPAPAAALKKKGRGERDERNDFDDDEEESPSWPNFVSAALSSGMDLFGTMLAVSRSPLFVSDSPISSLVSLPVSTSLALRAILKGFVLSITELVRPEFVLDFNGLVELWQATFGGATQDGAGGAELCAQFWEVDFEFAQRRAVLDTATRRWPVSFRPLLGLCKALSGASITSPTSSSSQSDAVLRAAMPVMRYLCEIESLAHVMPPTPSLAPPYQPWEEPGSPNAYKAIRPIPVFGQHLIIPAGTVGRMVSEADGAPVVVWDVSGLGISAWRLMRDVLANFVGLLPGQAPPRASTDDSRTGDGAVFAERHAPASFATLSPDDAGAHDAEAAANAMDLFSSILAAGPQLSALLLAHLEGDDASGLAEVQDPSIDDKPSLLNIALKVLDQALLAPATASRVIVSAYRLITLALASRPSDIWVAMRSSSALIGSSGLLPYSVRGAGASSSSSLLADEVSRGQFDGLNAVLDLHQSLLEDLQRTQFSISAEACQLKVDVMLRAARWICQAVWMEYQGWKYVKLRQRIEIGRKCVHFFDTILRDGCMRNAAESPAHRLSEAIEQTFVSHVSPLHLGPLVATLSQGQQLIDQLQKAIRQVEAEQARRLVQSCLGFAFAIVERRRLLNAESLTPTLGLFELMVFDHATVATRSVTIASRRSNRVELATAVVGYILLPFSRPLSIEAVRLLTSVCRSTAEVAAASSGGKGTASSPPTLVGHLGSLQDVEASMAGLVDVVASQERDDELRRETWTLLAAIVDTQPALATLLLTGRHLASDVERNMANSSSSGKNKAEERPATMARTAIDVAVEHLQNWERSWDSSPAVLEAVLRFLGVAWAHAAEHRSDFARLRSNKSIWKSLGDIAVKDSGQVPDRPEQWEVLEADEGEQAQEQSDEHVSVQRYAHRTLCSARALTLLAADIELAPSMARANAETKERQEESLETILSILSDGNLLQTSLVAAFDVQGDVAMHAEFQARLKATFPEVNLDDFRYSARHDDFDLSRRYGDGYCFDMGAFRLRLQGFLPSIEEQSEEMALDERSGLDNESLKQACLLVAAINLDWSIIDARTTYMRAWTRLLESVSEPYVSRSSDSRREDRLKQVQTTCLKAWTRCAAATADEEANGDVIMGIHSERVNLLSVLLELCWGSFSAREDGHQEPQKDFEPVVEAVEQSCRLVGHGVLRVEESLRSGGPGFHRGVFRIVLLCTRRSRSLLKQRAGVRLGSGEGKLKDQGGEDAHLHQRLHQSADLYTSQTITCLRVAIDNAWAALSSVERLQGYQSGERQVSEVVRASPLVEAAEDDLRLLMATLELLLRDDVGIPPHTWAPKMQTTGLLPAAVELFARAPLTMSSTTSTTALMTKMNSNGGDSRSDLSNTELLAAGACPVFGFTLLGFFLAMASSPNTAESLALAGITNALCANALSNLFDQSSPLEEQKPATATIPPLLNSGYENPTHTLWLQMLRVVLGLTHNLGLGNDRYYAGTTSLATVARFVEMELRGFLQVYWIQIERSVLQFSPLGAAASGSSLRRFNAAPLEDFATPSVAPTTLTLGQLDEMEEVVGLFLAVARVFSGPLASSASTSVEGKLLDLFVKRATSSTPMLQQLVYLVQHPRELASLLGASVDNSGWTREDEAGCVEQIARIAGQIVKIVWEWTGSVEVLWTEEEEWSLDSLVLSPTISTVPTSSASMGTLLDLAQFLSEKLRSLTTSDEAGGKDKAEDLKTEVGESLEQTLALAATQLAIAVHGRPSPTTNGQTAIQDDTTAQPSAPPREIETGLARDLETCIESCRAALRAAGGAKKASMFLDIVADFGKRVLASS
ncbi:hypothetical protein FA10DRAFT_276849 [Acaromyces ingoldii]|uniref:Nucleoporin NUP188 n=1 Tax=Acaromyces ingoldii TaxID=215250 RepID=A0A316YUB5_9BASI|nr:hypothetical protein FA10DRAFT_276849 [Acaromyces ingoldii]PWN92859.1 hypothetical protein FA10DRAFT_276849 [Acaromyces ingoldii]